jgi:hypothetical protein
MKDKKNSTIFKNPYEQMIHDFSFVGAYKTIDKTIEIEQFGHGFQVADVIFYNIKLKKFDKALAINSIESEVCGVVSQVLGSNTFRILTEGFLETDRYSFDVDTPLYLSESTSGKLMSVAPVNIVKQVATQASNGIIIDIQRGYKITDNDDSDDELELYTREELDEIIANIW